MFGRRLKEARLGAKVQSTMHKQPPHTTPPAIPSRTADSDSQKEKVAETQPETSNRRLSPRSPISIAVTLNGISVIDHKPFACAASSCEVSKSGATFEFNSVDSAKHFAPGREIAIEMLINSVRGVVNRVWTLAPETAGTKERGFVSLRLCDGQDWLT